MKVPEYSVPDFRHLGVCTDTTTVPLDLHFPVGDTKTRGTPGWLQAQEAKAVCRRCPVIDRCRKWALDTGQDYGVWGGMTEQERRALKRRTAARQDEVPAQRQDQDNNQPKKVAA